MWQFLLRRIKGFASSGTPVLTVSMDCFSWLTPGSLLNPQ
jgi:hypothetical protein